MSDEVPIDIVAIPIYMMTPISLESEQMLLLSNIILVNHSNVINRPFGIR